MSVRSIECQIARGQISRYLSGDSYSSEAVSQLEEHVSGCADCKQYLNERKSALQSMLGKPQSPAQTEHVPAPEEAPVPRRASEDKPAAAVATSVFTLPRLTDLLNQYLRSQASSVAGKSKPKEPVKPAAWKSIAYSIALAVVLGGMSLASRNMDRVFGPKAAVASEETPSDASESKPTPAKKVLKSAKKKKSAKKALALKPIAPIAANPEDVEAAALAAKQAAWTKKTLARLKSSQKAAQTLSNQYASEPAPRLKVPGIRPALKKPVAKPAVSSASNRLAKMQHAQKLAAAQAKHRAQPGAKPKVKLASKGKPVAKRAAAKPVFHPRPIQIEAHVIRRSHARVVRTMAHAAKKHKIVKKAWRPKAESSGIHVYAPDSNP